MARRLDVTDLGSMEMVTATPKATSRQEQHIEALERIVDELRDENRKLKKKLSAKPSTITQKQYDKVCKKLQAEYNKSIPF